MKITLLIILSLLSSGAFAQNIHFFGSVKASQATIPKNKIEFDNTSTNITLAPLTTAGFSFDASIDDKYQVLAQFIYRDREVISPDLIQLRHHFTADTAVRVGLQRLPSNLHSENIQIQALQPWIKAPREIYGRLPVYSFTGASLEKDLGSVLDVHLYAGDTKDRFEGASADYDTEANNLIGARLNFKFKNLTAFINSYRSEAYVTIKSESSAASATGVQGTTFGFNRSFRLKDLNTITAGAQYRFKEYFIMSEYSVVSSKNALLERIEGAYLTAGREINEKWIPVFTFSTDLDVDSYLSPSKTTTYAFNLNYRLDYNNIIKAGVEHVNYKERTVASTLPGGTSNASIFTNGSPGGNFDVYSLVWAFVY